VEWRLHCIKRLLSLDLWDVVGYEAPTFPNCYWHDANRAAMAEMIALLEEHLLKDVLDSKSATEMWLTLEKIHKEPKAVDHHPTSIPKDSVTSQSQSLNLSTSKVSSPLAFTEVSLPEPVFSTAVISEVLYTLLFAGQTIIEEEERTPAREIERTQQSQECGQFAVISEELYALLFTGQTIIEEEEQTLAPEIERTQQSQECGHVTSSNDIDFGRKPKFKVEPPTEPNFNKKIIKSAVADVCEMSTDLLALEIESTQQSQECGQDNIRSSNIDFG
jgi:hypothetical protein